MLLDDFLTYSIKRCFVANVYLLFFWTAPPKRPFQVQLRSEIISNAFLVLECSTSCPGGDLVDGLPPASSWQILVARTFLRVSACILKIAQNLIVQIENSYFSQRE